jgi:hypothetical protein
MKVPNYDEARFEKFRVFYTELFRVCDVAISKHSHDCVFKPAVALTPIHVENYIRKEMHVSPVGMLDVFEDAHICFLEGFLYPMINASYIAGFHNFTEFANKLFLGKC